jgi:hypothetical protein
MRKTSLQKSLPPHGERGLSYHHTHCRGYIELPGITSCTTSEATNGGSG